MLFVAALAGIFSGRGSPVEAANEVESDPTTPPCEFEEEADFCVNEVGDVYYNTELFSPSMSQPWPVELSRCVSGPDFGLCYTQSIGPGGELCEKGDDAGDDYSFCTKSDGKVLPESKLPRDVCENGTYRAPCDPKEAEA